MTIKTNLYSPLTALILIPILFFSSPVQSRDMQEMTITAFRVPQDTNTFAGSLDFLESDSLALTSHIHVQESLNRLAGVNFHRNDGQEYLAAIRSPVLTGAGSCGSMMTMEDGLPLRPTGFCNVNELFEAHSEHADRIELIRGPGTAVFGSKAVHGVVNIIDVVPLKQTTKLGLEAGAYGFGRVKAAGGSESWGAAFTAGTEDGYRDDSGNDQQKLSVRYRRINRNISLDTRLTITNLNQETAGFLEGENAYNDEVLARSNPNPEAFRDAQALRLDTKISDSEETWQIRPYLRYSDMSFLQHFLPGQPLEENGHHSAGVLSQYRFAIAKQLNLTAGLDLEYANSWLRQSQDDPTIGSEFLQETIPQGLHYDYQVHSKVIGSYAQLDWRINEKLIFGAGVRLEQVRYHYDNLMVDGRTRDDGSECGFGGCRYTRPTDGKDTFSNLSPKLSLSYELLPTSSIYVNLSSGFRAPETAELYRLQRDQTTADLDSEEVNSVEIGWRLNTRLADYELAIYDMSKRNVIFRDVAFFNVSDGQTDHRGIEANIRWQMSEQLSLFTAWNYSKHTYANNPGLSSDSIVGNDMDTAPRRFGSAQLRYEVASAVFEVEWLHMGSYFTDPENQHTYEGHDLFHLRAYVDAGTNWRFSLRLNNLLDERYAERADFSSFSGDRYFPGLPRRIYVGIEFQPH